MRHFEQRLDSTDQRLDDLEAIEVPHPSSFVTPQTIDAILTEKFNASYGSTLESITRLSASVAPQPLLTPTQASHPSGFFQKKSKDFHVSHLIKLLVNESLASDSLQDHEIFYNSILSHFNTIALTAELFA